MRQATDLDSVHGTGTRRQLTLSDEGAHSSQRPNCIDRFLWAAQKVTISFGIRIESIQSQNRKLRPVTEHLPASVF